MSDFPCHAGPKETWCDSNGAGGFMGHTCVKPEPVELTREDLLILLVEECGEVIQAATKCLRFGYEVDHGIGYGRNDHVLAKEAGDLVAILDAIKLDPFVMDKTYRAKIAKAQAAKARYGASVGAQQPRGADVDK